MSTCSGWSDSNIDENLVLRFPVLHLFDASYVYLQAHATEGLGVFRSCRVFLFCEIPLAIFMTHLLFLFDIVASRVGQEVELSQDSNRTPFQRLAAKRCLIYFFF